MKRLCALIGALLVSWLTLGSPAPAAASVPTEDLAYNYASHHAPNPAASNDLMRGPPVLTKGLTTYDATHQRARSASSRSNGATTASINTYVPAAYVPADARPRVERATTTTGASGGVAERDLSSLSGAQDAANAGGALVRVGDFGSNAAAFRHYSKHVKGVVLGPNGSATLKRGGADMPEFSSFAQYRAAARDFTGGGAGPGVIERTRGTDILRVDPSTGYFGVRSSDGTIRTFFRPTGRDPVDYFWSQ